MIRIIGTRGSGKTTKLLNLAEEDGYVIVEPNAKMTDHVRHMAAEKGLNVNVVSAHELLYRQHGVIREKYLVDELEMFLASLGIEGYTDNLLKKVGETEMKWEEFKNRTTPEPQFINLIKTSIECPKCGRNLYFRTNVVLTSFPAQYKYECECGFVGYSHAQWQEGR